jgi:cytochrome oxidase assembly protein ShyY1
MRKNGQRAANKAILIVLSALCFVMIVFLGAWTLVAHLR